MKTEAQLHENGFTHPCKGLCSGYEQGRQDGIRDAIEFLMDESTYSNTDSYSPLCAKLLKKRFNIQDKP